jgi:hypothetical protein
MIHEAKAPLDREVAPFNALLTGPHHRQPGTTFSSRQVGPDLDSSDPGLREAPAFAS